MSSPPDMFDKTKAHRESFTVEAADREDKIRALSPEKKAQVNALENRIAELAKDQDRRRPAELDMERRKAGLEHPRLDHPGPKGNLAMPSTTKSAKEIIEEKAAKSLEAKYVKEKAELIKDADKEVKDIVQRPDRLDKELPENATSSEIKEREFAEAAFEMTSYCSELTPDQAALAKQIQARWDAERGMDHDLGREK